MHLPHNKKGMAVTNKLPLPQNNLDRYPTLYIEIYALYIN